MAIRRNQLKFTRQEMGRIASQAAGGAAAHGAGVAATSGVRAAGAIDGSGAFQPFGVLNVTEFGSFILSDRIPPHLETRVTHQSLP